MNWLRNLFGIYQEFGGVPRSSRWSSVRRQHLNLNPTCAVCNTKKNLSCHHLLPYNKFPAEELNPENLVTLCESAGMNCHITFGHLGDFKFYNQNALEDIGIWHAKFLLRTPNSAKVDLQELTN